MPFIRVSLSKQFSEKQVLEAKSELGKLITLLKGKDESKLMLDFVHSPRMFYRGDGLENGAFLECHLFGPMAEEDKNNFSEATFVMLKNVFGIEPTDIFITFTHHGDWASSGTYKVRS